jgi:branched-chain amino acid transport system substrate-binding protein
MNIGVQMAVEDINNAGGVKVGGRTLKLEVIIEDYKSTVADTVPAAEKLITVDKVNVLGGLITSGADVAIFPLLEKYRVPLVTTSIWHTKATQGHFKWIFRQYTCNYENAKFLVNFFKYYNITRVVLINENKDWAYDLSSCLVKALGLYAKGIKYQTFVVDSTALDFSPEITAAKEFKPEAVVGMIWGSNGYRFCKQAYELGLINRGGVIYIHPSGHEAYWPETWSILGEGANYNIYLVFWYPGLEITPLTRPFVEKFEQRAGRPCSKEALAAYDTILAIAKGVELAGSLDPDAIVSGLEKVDIDGVGGRIKFVTDESKWLDEPYWWHHKQDKMYLVQYSGDAYKYWDPSKPANVFKALAPIYPTDAPGYRPLIKPP